MSDQGKRASIIHSKVSSPRICVVAHWVKNITNWKPAYTLVSNNAVLDGIHSLSFGSVGFHDIENGTPTQTFVLCDTSAKFVRVGVVGPTF